MNNKLRTSLRKKIRETKLYARDERWRPGPVRNLVRDAWMDRFALTFKDPKYILNEKMLCQLCFCKDDESRRILLGVSR